MSPDIIGKIRDADQKHAELMSEQGIDLAKLNAAHQEAMAASMWAYCIALIWPSMTVPSTDE